MAWPIRSLILYLGLPLLSVGALTLYLWKKEEEEWKEMMKGLNLVERDVRIPQNTVAALVGKGGVQIREIQEMTNTKINFRDGENHLDYATCRITGKSENVSKAVDYVMEIINKQGSWNIFEMWVPSSSCGRIIGRCGEVIQSLAKTSGARINIDKKEGPSLTRKLITIRGTDEQIKMAISLIEEKVKEHEEAQNKLHLTNSNRFPRGQTRISNGSTLAVQKPEYERLIATTGETMLQVYVSAVASPVHLWVQVITPRAADLDLLVEEMTEYYKKEENRQPIDIDQITKGQIVACLMSDTKWYRVEICSVHSRADCIEDSKIDVFYVDYGESEYVSLGNLSHLPNDFLKLRFQAIEAHMVGIAPMEGEEWTEAAIDCFVDMTCCGQWRAMVAEIVGYRKGSKNTAHSGSPIPCIKLYDPDGAPGIDLGTQLVQKNMAKQAPIEDLSPQFDLNVTDDENW
uniref:Tudor and KH domain-containing protein n=3 Tax=Lygus hesperus TaxID=30085 RepID=A0A0A9YPK3_LYGHE